jgi:hypothetical protein
MAIATTPAVRYVPSATKVPTAQNYLDLSDINTSITNYRTWTKTNKRYGSQMIDGWFEKQVVKALTLVMLSLGQKRTD